jgi:hypothetical protein
MVGPTYKNLPVIKKFPTNRDSAQQNRSQTCQVATQLDCVEVGPASTSGPCGTEAMHCAWAAGSAGSKLKRNTLIKSTV